MSSPPEHRPAVPRRLAAAAGPLVYRFDTTDALLQFGRSLTCRRVLPAASLYRARGYVLVLYTDGGDIAALHRQLCEYAVPHGRGDAVAACVAEHAVPLLIGNALAVLSPSHEPCGQKPPRPAR